MEELEAELKAERSRQRALTTEQSRAQREKEAVLLDLRRTESVCDDRCIPGDLQDGGKQLTLDCRI